MTVNVMPHSLYIKITMKSNSYIISPHGGNFKKTQTIMSFNFECVSRGLATTWLLPSEVHQPQLLSCPLCFTRI